VPIFLYAEGSAKTSGLFFFCEDTCNIPDAILPHYY